MHPGIAHSGLGTSPDIAPSGVCWFIAPMISFQDVLSILKPTEKMELFVTNLAKSAIQPFYKPHFS
jgi:hypothetical protein